MPYEIWNRRYTGSKYKLADWIFNIIDKYCIGESFCDIFAGTGILARKAINKMKTVYINDFLYSNELIYKAFFMQKKYSRSKLENYRQYFQSLCADELEDNYITYNFGNKFFSYNDAKLIGQIREILAQEQDLNEKEFSILIASLLYSADKVANTVGHYDAYIKNISMQDKFKFDLISTYDTKANIYISRQDANLFAKNLECDIVYIDPPYNSRQYSRFYHVLENITTWKKPQLFGVALKPQPENMSEYSRNNALNYFQKLVQDLKCKYILVSYNNTYLSKSSSSINKMTLENIVKVLSSRGKVSCHEKPHQYFNAGKTSFVDHKELLFLVEVEER